jgi:hypothetical protein
MSLSGFVQGSGDRGGGDYGDDIIPEIMKRVILLTDASKNNTNKWIKKAKN